MPNKGKIEKAAKVPRERMRQITVKLDLEDKFVLLLESFRFQLTVSKLMRVLLLNAIDLPIDRSETVPTPSDLTTYFSVWGQRLIVLGSYYYELMVRSGQLDNREIEAFDVMRDYLHVIRQDDLNSAVEETRKGEIKFNVSVGIYGIIEKESKKKKISRSEFVRDVIEKYTTNLKGFYRFLRNEDLYEENKNSIRNIKEEFFEVLLRAIRQMTLELDSLATIGVKGNPLPPTQLVKNED